nr:hypothetical protein [Tanacetum cinerariifolium]
IGLGYESIHACEHDCCLFRRDDNKDLDFCSVCNTSRWKDSNTPRKKVLKKVLRYFPIIPRLQRLYKSSHTAKEMIWHATGKCTEPGEMQHPVDGRAWKKFDTKYLDFAKEPRNVRLRLVADGFNLFGNLSQAYSMWPAILTTYNLPLWLCMKECSFMLTLLIPGPKSPGKDIDVYLRPLTEELKQYLPDKIVKPIIELCSLFKQICSATLMEDDMLKAQIKVVDILCDLELIYPPALFDIMIHLVIHLPLEALEGEPIRPRWMFSFERYMKKLKDNDKDPEVITTSELFALGYGPTWTSISINTCVVAGVRHVVHNRDERRTTQNSGICSLGPDGEMYYEDDPDIIHFYNSFDLSLSTSLNDLDNGTVHIDGQSTEVDAPPDIIGVVDEDDDIIDNEDAIPHDLADFDDEDLINVDDDDFARSHDGDGEDRPHHTMYPPVAGVALLIEIRTSGLLQSQTKAQFERQGSWQAEYPRQDPKPLIKGNHGYKRGSAQPLKSTRRSLTPSSWHTLLTENSFGIRTDEELRRLEATGTYTDDEINRLARGGKQRGHISGVGRVLPARATASPSTSAHESTLNSLHKKVDFMMSLFKSDSKYSDMFSQFESGGASGSGGCGDDEESADDQDDGDEDGYGDS